jgi:predicted acyl esterase
MQYNWSENFALAFNAVFRTDENTGSASGTTLRDRKRFGYVGYLHYKTKRWSFTPRIEFFTDENTTETAQDGVALAKDDLKFTSYTFTTSYAFRSNTELRLEFRSDQANQNFYVKDGNTQKGQNTLSLAWLMSY